MAKKPQTFTVAQNALNKALQICGRALSDNNILPVNSMYLFDIERNKLNISACDMKSIISTTIEIQSSVVIKICIPGKKLADYIAKSAPELMVFEIEEHITPEAIAINPNTQTKYVQTPEQISLSVTIKTKSGKCAIPCENGEDFPQISNKDPQPFTLSAADFVEVLYKTMFAISDDQLRPSATGLNICIEGKMVTCTALDFNMVATYSLPTKSDFSANLIIPKKALQQIQSLAPVGELDCQISKSAISINWGDIRTTSLLIDEKYPDYLAITPVTNDIDFLTSRAALISSLKRVLPFADAGKLVKFQISKSDLLLTAKNIDLSEEASETIAGVGTADIVIGINGEYLLQILGSFTDDKLWFSFSEPNRTVIITDGEKHVNPGKENLILLMPLRISE